MIVRAALVAASSGACISSLSMHAVTQVRIFRVLRRSALATMIRSSISSAMATCRDLSPVRLSRQLSASAAAEAMCEWGP